MADALPPLEVLVSPYDPGGLAVYGTADALRQLAEGVRGGTSLAYQLANHLEEIDDEAGYSHLRVIANADETVNVSVDDDTVAIRGGATARARLAGTIEGLASEVPLTGPLLRHADIEYFDGHPFLAEPSMWMTVFLLPRQSSH